MTFSAVAQAEPTRLNGSTGQRVKVGNVPDDDQTLLSEFGKVSAGNFCRRNCVSHIIRQGRAYQSHIATVPYCTKPGSFYCDPFSLWYGPEMLGLFNVFGRAEGLKALDQALREFDVHPQTVPEAVKLTTIRLMQKASDAEYVLRDADYKKATELLSYCILGPDQFLASNSLTGASLAGKRLEEAIAAGDGLDAELVLLALHSGVMHSTIADQFDIEENE